MVPDDEAHITVQRLNSFPGPWFDNVVAFVAIENLLGVAGETLVITPFS